MSADSSQARRGVSRFRVRLATAVLIALLLGGLACQPLDNFRRALTNIQQTQIVPSLVTPPG
jgi:hypothetical protein